MELTDEQWAIVEPLLPKSANFLKITSLSFI